MIKLSTGTELSDEAARNTTWLEGYLTAHEMVELADIMIARWTTYRKKAQAWGAEDGPAEDYQDVRECLLKADTIPVTIRVTSEDLDIGEPCKGSYCPAARAINRVLKHPYWCQVGDFGNAYVYSNYYDEVRPNTKILRPALYTAWAPPVLAAFVVLYDETPADAKPLEFEITLPREVVAQ